MAAMIACDLLRWLRLLWLDGPLAKAEPKTLRYRLLHTAVRLVRGQRKRKIKIPETWPCAHDLETRFRTALTFTLTRTTPPHDPQHPSRPVEPAPTRCNSRAPGLTHRPKSRSEQEVEITKISPETTPGPPVNDQG